MSSQDEPEVRMILANKLMVDTTVQRPLDQTRVNSIIAKYNPDGLGVIILSSRDNGRYHVVDGQHRVAATVGAGYGDRTLKCLVYTGLALADEASMFELLNTTRAVNAVDRFRVRVVAGEETAVLLNKLIVNHGWTVRQGKSTGVFAAVASFESVYRGKRGGTQENLTTCEQLMGVITQSWGHDPDGARAEIVSGVGAVLLRFPEIDFAKLTRELSQVQGGPRPLVGKAKSLRNIRGGTVADSMAEIVVNLVNKGRRTNLLPDWHSFKTGDAA